MIRVVNSYSVTSFSDIVFRIAPLPLKFLADQSPGSKRFTFSPLCLKLRSPILEVDLGILKVFYNAFKGLWTCMYSEYHVNMPCISMIRITLK